MVRLAVVACFALVACDCGSSKQSAPAPAPPPPPGDAAAAPTDAPPPVDAGVVDAEVIDAAVLAPPKAAAAQKRDCGKIAKMHFARTYSNDEEREFDTAIRALCTDTPWSATVVDCILRAAKSDDNTWNCLDLLPPEQKQAFDKKSKEIFCEHNDCIPPGVGPMRLSGSGSGDIDLDL